MEPAEKVALLALMYREKQAPWWEFQDDLSLLGKQVRDVPLAEIDEFILNHMDKVEELREIMVELAGVDELRYEALLHSWPPGPNNDPPPEGPWKPYSGDRWLEVEDAMSALYKTGITHKPSFINAIFEEAYALAQAGTQH
jgi:hypothetical protein